MKTLFEPMGGSYTMQGNYELPNLALSPGEEQHIGVWRQRRLRYMKQHHKVMCDEQLIASIGRGINKKYLPQECVKWH